MCKSTASLQIYFHSFLTHNIIKKTRNIYIGESPRGLMPQLSLFGLDVEPWPLMSTLSLALGCILFMPCLPAVLHDCCCFFLLLLLFVCFYVHVFLFSAGMSVESPGGEFQVKGQGKEVGGSTETVYKLKEHEEFENSLNLDGVDKLRKCPIGIHGMCIHITNRKIAAMFYWDHHAVFIATQEKWIVFVSTRIFQNRN